MAKYVGKPTGGGCVIAVLGISQLIGLRENLRVQQVMVLTPKYKGFVQFSPSNSENVPP